MISSLEVPRGVVRFRIDAEPWLRQLGYVPYGKAVDDDEREVFHQSPTRENATLEPGPRGPGVFEKRSRALTLSMLRKVYSRAGRLTSPLLHEWDLLWKARERGLLVPEPVAAGMSRGLVFPRTDFLITERLEGTALIHLLDWAVSRPAAEQIQFASAIGAAIARLHAAGFSFPDLYAKHVYVKRAGDGGWNVGFLDLASAYLTKDPSRGERARDLGALAGSLPFSVPRRLLAAFLRSYLASRAGWSFADAWRLARDHAAKHLRLRRFRRGLSPRLETARPRTSTGAHVSRDQRATLALLTRFDVPLQAEAPAVVVRDEIAGPLSLLLQATIRAGVLPTGAVLPHVRAAASGGRLAWAPAAPLRAPRRARAIHARWRLFLLRREIAASPLSSAARRSVLDGLGPELVAAFALTRPGVS